jgi:uncharacterized membrane protein YedE/YeeE
MKALVGLLCGLLFGFGLTVSQMVNPQKVQNFLDILGNWDASLAFVMGGALFTFGLGYFILIKGKQQALLGDNIPNISKAPIDAKLVIGASLFGVGWGLSGICPGPAFANISALNSNMLLFIVVMIVGLKLGGKIKTMPN